MRNNKNLPIVNSQPHETFVTKYEDRASTFLGINCFLSSVGYPSLGPLLPKVNNSPDAKTREFTQKFGEITLTTEIK